MASQVIQAIRLKKAVGGAQAEENCTADRKQDSSLEVLEKACEVWKQVAARSNAEECGTTEAGDGAFLEEYMGEDLLGKQVCEWLKEARACLVQGESGPEFACLRKAESILRLWAQTQLRQTKKEGADAIVTARQSHHMMRYYLSETVLLTHIAMHHRRVGEPYAALQNLMKAVSNEHHLIDAAKEVGNRRAPPVRKPAMPHVQIKVPCRASQQDPTARQPGMQDVAALVAGTPGEIQRRDSPWVMACRLLAEARVNLSAMFVEMGQYPEALQHGLRGVSLMTRGLKAPESCEGRDAEDLLQEVSNDMFLSSCEALAGSLRAVGCASEFLDDKRTALEAYKSAAVVAEHLPESHPVRVEIPEAILSLCDDKKPTSAKVPPRKQVDRQALRRVLTGTHSQEDLQCVAGSKEPSILGEADAQLDSEAATSLTADQEVQDLQKCKADAPDRKSRRLIDSMRRAAEGTLDRNQFKLMQMFRHLEFALVKHYRNRSCIFKSLDGASLGFLSRSSWISAVSQIRVPGLSSRNLAECFDLVVKASRSGRTASPAQPRASVGYISENDFISFCEDQSKVWICMPSHAKATVVDAPEIFDLIKGTIKERFGSLREAFKNADYFMNHRLSLSEFHAAFRKWEITGIADPDIDLLFSLLDIDNSGVIEYGELARFFQDGSEVDGFASQVEQLSEDVVALIRDFERRCLLRFGSLEQAFSIMNVDSNMHISQEEFTNALMRWNLSEGQIAEFWKALDIGCEGEISIARASHLCSVAAGSGRDIRDQPAEKPLRTRLLRSKSAAAVHNQSSRLFDEFSRWGTKDGRVGVQNIHPAGHTMSESFDLLRKHRRDARLYDRAVYAGSGADRLQLIEEHATCARSLKARKAMLARKAEARRPARPWSAGAVGQRSGQEPPVLGSDGQASPHGVGKPPKCGGSDHVQNLRNLVAYARGEFEQPPEEKKEDHFFDGLRDHFRTIRRSSIDPPEMDPQNGQGSRVSVSFDLRDDNAPADADAASTDSSVDTETPADMSESRTTSGFLTNIERAMRSNVSVEVKSSDGGTSEATECNKLQPVATPKPSQEPSHEWFPSMIGEDHVHSLRATLCRLSASPWYVLPTSSSHVSSPQPSMNLSAMSKSRVDGDSAACPSVHSFQQTVVAELDDYIAETTRKISGSRSKLADMRHEHSRPSRRSRVAPEKHPGLGRVASSPDKFGLSAVADKARKQLGSKTTAKR